MESRKECCRGEMSVVETNNTIQEKGTRIKNETSLRQEADAHQWGAERVSIPLICFRT